MSEFETTDLSSWEPPPEDSRRPASLPDPPPPPAPNAPSPAAPEAGASKGPAAGGPVAWKAAASSVPKLRQKPHAPASAAPAEAFPGFAQDAPATLNPAALGERATRAGESAPGDEAPAAATPLSVEPPFWELWIDRLRVIPLPVAIGGCVGLLLVVALAIALLPHEQGRVSLARIRQQPEAYDGRVVHVRGQAGEVLDRKSTRLNSSHIQKSRMPSSA